MPTPEQFHCPRGTHLATTAEFDNKLWGSIAMRLHRNPEILAGNDDLRVLLASNLILVGVQYCTLYCQQVCQAIKKPRVVLNTMIGDAVEHTCRDIQVNGLPPGL